ncbi:MAG: hypothetical protein ACRDZ6_07305 [Acidimicrobiales bacterium]
MPGENFSRRVARAASVGGGRSYKAQSPRGWSLILLVICLVGVALIGYSRYERTHPVAAAPKPSVPPTASSEWRMAVAVDVCGRFDPTALPETPATTADAFLTLPRGVVDLAPARSAAPTFYEGHKAVLGLYLAGEGVSLTKQSLVLPGKLLPVHKTAKSAAAKGSGKTAGTSTSTSSSTSTSTSTSTNTSTSTSPSSSSSVGSKSSSSTSTSSSTTTTTTSPKRGPARTYTTGKSRCGASTGVVEVMVWRSPSSTGGRLVSPKAANTLRFRNGQLVVVAFVKKGTAIPKPPGAGTVAQWLIANPHGRYTGPASPSSTPTSSVPVTSSTVTGPTTPSGSTGSTSPSAGTSSSSSTTSTTGTK